MCIMSKPGSQERVPSEAHQMKPEVRDAPYQFAGAFYEACDCYSICPCWTGNDPDEDQCTGIFAWDIEQGEIDGTDVAGLRAVSVSHHAGFRGEGARQRVVIFVDDTASQRKSDALVAALTGSLGGPLGELAGLLGELLAVEHASITLRHEGRLTTLSVGQRLMVEGVTTEGVSGHLITLSDGKLSEVLGTPAEVGESCRFRIGLPELNMEMDLRGRSTMRGRFSYTHTPGSN
jgi:hypothetical protein